MKTCVPSCQAPTPTSQPRLVRRVAASAQPCAVCGYHPPLPYATGSGSPQS